MEFIAPVPDYPMTLVPDTMVLGGDYVSPAKARVFMKDSTVPAKYKEVRQDIEDYLTAKFRAPDTFTVRREGYSYKGVIVVDGSYFYYELSSLGFETKEASVLTDLAEEMLVKYQDQEAQEDLEYARMRTDILKALPREKEEKPVQAPDTPGMSTKKAGPSGAVRSTYPNEAGKKAVQRAAEPETPKAFPQSKGPEAQQTADIDAAQAAAPPQVQAPVQIQATEGDVDPAELANQLKLPVDTLRQAAQKFASKPQFGGETGFVDFCTKHLSEVIEKHKVPTAYFHKLYQALTQAQEGEEIAKAERKAYQRLDPRSGKMVQVGATYYKGHEPGSDLRISTNTPEWDNHIFMADDPNKATSYGTHIEEIQLHPHAKILKEGTPEWRKVTPKPKKGDSLLSHGVRVVGAAKAAGYDVLHFSNQRDVGTLVLNPSIIASRKGWSGETDHTAEGTRKHQIYKDGLPVGDSVAKSDHHKAYQRRNPKNGNLEQVKAKGTQTSDLGSSWWEKAGFRANPGWDGSWVNTHANDPQRYDSAGAIRASKHLTRMRDLRRAGQLSRSTLEACALFAITSVKVPSTAHEKQWPNIAKWLQETPGDTDKLLKILRPLGMYNTRIKAFKDFQAFVPVLVKALNKYPEDAQALRRYVMSQPEAKNVGVQHTKLSFVLELLGYQVACIDSRVVQHLTGLPPGKTVDKIRAKMSVNADLYEAFEGALKRSAAYRESDPEGLRLGVAQWRMWNTQGGDDADHAVFWKSLAKITGVPDFAKALLEKGDILSAMMEASAMQFGLDSPVVFDGGSAVLY